MVWVIAFGELFFGDLWCVVWGYGGMRTHFSLLNPSVSKNLRVARGPAGAETAGTGPARAGAVGHLSMSYSPVDAL